METFPRQNNIYSNEISRNARQVENELVRNSFKNSINAIESNIIPRNYNENILNKTNKLSVHNQLQDIKEHNNNEKKFMISPLTGQKIPVEQFNHNNMVPFFGSNIKQNTSEEFSYNKLEQFTGSNKHFRNKSEVPIMFEPSKNVNQVNGTPVYNNELQQRYIASSKKQNELPIRQVRVGPGLNQGYSSKPCGGLNQSNKRDFMLPKNVNELRTLNNPKMEYKGRVVAGLKSGQRGISAKVNKNKPDSYYRNCPDRYFTSVVVPKNRVRDKVRAKRTNRQCSTSYSGTAGPVNNVRPEKRGLYRKSRKNCYVNSGIRNADAQGHWDVENDEENYGKNSFNLPLNERDTTQKDSPLLNLATAVKSIIAPVQDLLKNSKKENFVGNVRPNGNFGAQMPKKMTVHDANDIARTTIKETNIHNSRSGNTKGPVKLTVYDPNDVARTTTKETNIHNSRTGNLNGPNKISVHDPNDVTRTTIKETNIHNERSGNINGPSKLQVYDPNDVARTTIKETNIHDSVKINLTEQSGSKQIIYNQDEAKVTVRNTLDEVDKTLNMSGVDKKLTVHDPNDVPQATVKDTNIHHSRTGNVGNQTEEGAYLVTGTKAKNTHRQFTSDIEYTGNPDGDVGRGNGEGYLTNNYEAKNVNRQFIADNEYTGGANSEHEKPKSYDDAYNAQLNYNKEKIAVGRSPTETGTKVSIGESDINIDIKKLESDIINIREMNVNKIYSAVPGKIEPGQTTERVPLKQDVNVSRIENDVLDAFKKNPYTQSLSSY